MAEPEFHHPRIELVPAVTLTPNPKNARTHTDRQIKQIGESLRRFGFLVPIVIDEANRIVAGHGRWLAAKELGHQEVPVIRALFLTEADRRAFALAENRLAELSGWDEDLLKAELEFLFDANYEISATGFELSDLDFSVSTARPEEPVELPAEDAVPVSRPGDLWIIGDHRLYCGNARDLASFEVVLDQDFADLIIADPPYNVPINGHVSGLGRVSHCEFVEGSGEMSPAEFTSFLRSVFRNCARISKDGSIHFHFMDWRHMREILDAADGVYSEFKQLIVWQKSNAGMGAFYRSHHELVFAFKSGRGRHINNFSLGGGGRYRTNVWSYPGCNTFRRGRDADLESHPTVKPIALLIDAILDCSNRGDLVLDPFSGSGSTLIAAHKAGRRGAAIELDPLYVDTGVRRLCAATGFIAQLPDGRIFPEVSAERLGACHV